MVNAVRIKNCEESNESVQINRQQDICKLGAVVPAEGVRCARAPADLVRTPTIDCPRTYSLYTYPLVVSLFTPLVIFFPLIISA